MYDSIVDAKMQMGVGGG